MPMNSATKRTLLSASGAARRPPPPAARLDKPGGTMTSDDILEVAAPRCDRECGESPPTRDVTLPPHVSSAATKTSAVETNGYDGGVGVVAMEAQDSRTVTSTGDGAHQSGLGAGVNEFPGVDNHTKSDEVPEHEIDIGDGCQSSAERNIWSVFNPMWSTFIVNKARLPRGSDWEADWPGTVGRPSELKNFLGLKNPVNRKTVGFLRRCIEEKLVVDGILLRGPAGSGKTALMKLFLSEFLEGFASNPEAQARLHRTRVLNVTPEELEAPPNKLASRVKRFFTAKKDRLADVVPRFIVVDGIERVPSKSQSALVTMIESAVCGTLQGQGGGNSGGGGSGDDGGAGGMGVSRGASSAGLRVMLTTRDASKMTASLRKCVKPFKMEVVDEVDGVKIVLRMLQRESVGYELLAIKAIFRMYWPDLERCIDVAKKVFCEKEFLSEENTLKVIAPKTLAKREEMSHHVRASAALEPLGLCPACTLRPPCQHISEQELAAKGLRRRMELPQRRHRETSLLSSERVAGVATKKKKKKKKSGEREEDGILDCQDFLRRGACRAFNDRGRCSNHHPLDAHIVEIPRPRCPQCTIRLPCEHCDYDRSRKRLDTFCEAAGARIQKSTARLRRLLKAGSGSRDGGGSGGGGGDEKGDEGARGGLVAIVAVTAAENNAGSNPSPTVDSNNQSDSRFKNRSDGINCRGVRAVLTKLDAIGSDLEAERLWVTDGQKPNGGMHEMRYLVFERKLEGLFRRCEEAHEEASAATEAFLKIQ